MNIKICGNTAEKDIELLNKFLPEFAGFIFAESKRRVTAEQAAALIKQLNPKVKSIGVFVDHKPEDIAQVAEKCGLWGLQFHGPYTEKEIKEAAELTGLVTIKCIHTKDTDYVQNALHTDADFLLFDAYDENAAGGTGKSADLELIGAARASLTKPIFIAGGINAQNAHFAMQFSPYAIDVCSSVENNNGGKDEAKMQALFEAVRGGV